ncbi:MAG: hypothetical protein WA991_04045 [Ornithinimicrobium sp.]
MSSSINHYNGGDYNEIERPQRSSAMARWSNPQLAKHEDRMVGEYQNHQLTEVKIRHQAEEARTRIDAMAALTGLGMHRFADVYREAAFVSGGDPELSASLQGYVMNFGHGSQKTIRDAV